MKLEEVSCALCGTTESDRLFESQNTRVRATDLKFTVRRCRQCGLACTSPRPAPDEMAALYGGQYFAPKVHPWMERLTRAVARERVSFVRALQPGGALLDVGCGKADFLKELPEDRFSIHGLEPYHGQFETIPERLCARIKFEPFATAHYDEASFDVITLWHVLEHLPEPLACLEKIHRLVKPDGVFVAEVPNFGSLEARWLGSLWYGLDVPYHLWHFTPRTLEALARRAGFKTAEVDTFTLTRPILLINYLLLGAGSIDLWAKKRCPVLERWAVLNKIVRVLSAPVCLVERLGLFFSTPMMRIVCRK